MQKHLLLVICVLFSFFSACKKSASPALPVSIVTATIDGVTENFTVSNYATNFDGTRHTLSILAVAGKAANADQISIVISSDSVIRAKTYSNTDKTGLINIIYVKGAISNTDVSNQYTTDQHGLYPVSITISTYTIATLQGSFSGTVVSNAGITKAVTGGQFKVFTDQPNYFAVTTSHRGLK